jgi:hypothetical protein
VLLLLGSILDSAFADDHFTRTLAPGIVVVANLQGLGLAPGIKENKQKKGWDPSIHF